MWFGARIVAYAGLVLGYLVLLSAAIRGRIEHGRAQRFLEATAVLALLRTTIPGASAFLVVDGWWALAWQRVAQVGLVVLAFFTAGLTNAFVLRFSRQGLRAGLVALFLAAALALDALPARTSVLPWFPLGPGLTDLATGLLAVALLSFTRRHRMPRPVAGELHVRLPIAGLEKEALGG